MNLIDNSFKGLDREFIRDIFKDSDLIIKLTLILMHTIPPFFVRFLHQLHLQWIISSFFPSDFDVNGLILFNVSELEHVTIIGNFLTF